MVFSDAAAPDRSGRDTQADRRQGQQGRTARSSEATTIAEGEFRVHSGANMKLEDDGEFTIQGGAFRMTSDDGTVGLLYFGPNASGDPTWLFSYRDGEIAGGLYGSTSASYWSWVDRAGHPVFSVDGQTGVGLAQPYLNIPMVPSSGTSVVVGGPFWPAFTNVSYQEVLHCITTLWHPRISIGVGANNGGSGTVEWELRVNGVTAGSNSGTTSGTYNVPGWGSTIKPDGVAHSVQLWARNTSGVQSRVIVDRCYGLQS
jgi:hypothetical protein